MSRIPPSEAAQTENSAQTKPSPESSKGNGGGAWLLAVLIVLGAVLRFLYLSRKSFWFDEGVSVQIARLDWYNFLRILWRREANMSLYYLLLRGWLHLGHSEFFIRSLSVLPSLACIPAIYLLGRRLFDARVGLISAALLTFNAYAIRYAQDARAYSLFIFLTLLSCVYFVSSAEASSRGNFLGHVISSTLAMYAHFYAGLLIVAQWLSLRFLAGEHSGGDQRCWRDHWKWIGILSAPALLFAATTGVGPLSWIKRPGFKALYEYYEHMAGNVGVWLVLAYVLACGAALAPLGRQLFRRQRAWRIWRYEFLLIWLLFPIAFTAVVSLVRPMFVARYFVFCLPALIILAAAGLARIPRVWLLIPAVGLLLALSLKGTLSYYEHDFDLDRDDWRSATYYILNHAKAGDVIMFHIAMSRMPYEFYKSVYPAGARGPTVIYPARAGGINYRDFMGKPSADFIQSAAVSYDRVWVVLKDNQAKDGGPDFTTQLIGQVFGIFYSTRNDELFSGIEVRLYEHRSGVFRH
ncbi:MAG TPA: glycosyltransferase family 39 protein [Terriglobales bacterium]|nr:glycosyltransferase family 39 protein [Terriglobales bacterium]